MASSWDDIEKGFEEVLCSNTISKKRFMELYTHIHNYCTSLSNKKIQSTRMPQTFSMTMFYHGYSDLYSRIRRFLSRHLLTIQEECQNLEEEALLQFFADSWRRYKHSIKVLNGLCGLLNKNWAKKEFNVGKDNVYDMYHLCLVSWREYVLKPLCMKVNWEVLRAIDRERHGEMVEAGIIAGVMANYLDIAEEDPLYDSFLKIYTEYFEVQFLEDSQQFYLREINACRDNSLADYLKKVEKRLVENSTMDKRYFHQSTLDRLKGLCGEVMIQNSMDLLQSEFQQLIRDDAYEDLARLSRFLERKPNMISEFRFFFESLVKSDGKKLLLKCEESGIPNFKVYISAILDIYHKYNALVQLAWNQDAGFTKALDTACKDFINNNCVTQRAENPGKSSELLAQYCDWLLKKRSKIAPETDLEEAFDHVIIVLKYLEDLDVFQKFYGVFLIKRLLLHLSVSEEAEVSLLLKLKLACGNCFTCKFYRLLHDFTMAKIQNKEFKDYLENEEESLGLDCSVYVLTSGLWPLEKSKTFTLPWELDRCVEQFDIFFTSKHSCRSLHWVYNMSRGEVETTCFRKRYSFRVTTHQLAILLHFNSAYAFTVQQLQEYTAIKLGDLLRILQTLLKSKLLLTEDSNLHPTSVVALNLEYNNKKLHVNLGVSLKPGNKEVQAASWSNIDHERRLCLEAAVVRIMKMRRRLNHQPLILEVINQLSSRFKVSLDSIEACIDDVINRGYITRERVDDSVVTYTYVA